MGWPGLRRNKAGGLGPCDPVPPPMTHIIFFTMKLMVFRCFQNNVA